MTCLGTPLHARPGDDVYVDGIEHASRRVRVHDLTGAGARAHFVGAEGILVRNIRIRGPEEPDEKGQEYA